MHSFTNLALLALPLLASAATWVPTTTNVIPASVPTDIVPFAFLPSCAQLCGPLFDAQGACSPPAAKSIDKACFCSYVTLQPFRTGTLNVCSATTCSADPGGLLSIQQWFINYCGIDSNGNGGAATTTTSTGSAPTSTSGSSTGGGGGGGTSSETKSQSWIDTHYQWIIMVVVLVVAIVGGWIGACMLRRRYLRKKELNYEMRPPNQPWVAGHTTRSPYGHDYEEGVPGKNKEMPTMTALTEEERRRKGKSRSSGKWIVKERT